MVSIGRTRDDYSAATFSASLSRRRFALGGTFMAIPDRIAVHLLDPGYERNGTLE